jgi:hypothetical protein
MFMISNHSIKLSCATYSLDNCPFGPAGTWVHLQVIFGLQIFFPGHQSLGGQQNPHIRKANKLLLIISTFLDFCKNCSHIFEFSAAQTFNIFGIGAQLPQLQHQSVLILGVGWGCGPATAATPVCVDPGDGLGLWSKYCCNTSLC